MWSSNRLIYGPDAHTGSFLMSVVRGTFLFITGQIAPTGPDAVQVRTPAGVIGIRGTTFGCAGHTGHDGTCCVLLPDPNGHVGRVAFTNGGGMTVVSHALDGVTATSYLSSPESLHLTPGEAMTLLAGALGRDTGGRRADGGSAALRGPLAGRRDPCGVRDDGARCRSCADAAFGRRYRGAQDVFTSAAYALEGNLIFGDHAALTLGGSVPSVTVSYEGGDGTFHSALGYYVVDPTGRIGEPHLLTTDLAALQPGDATSFVVGNGGQGLVQGATVAMFLVADGHDLNPAFQSTPASAIQLQLEERRPGGLFPHIPDVGDAGLQLHMRTDGSKLVPVAGDLWQTADHIGGPPIGDGVVDTTGLNVDPTAAPSLVPLDGQGNPTTSTIFSAPFPMAGCASPSRTLRSARATATTRTWSSTS